MNYISFLHAYFSVDSFLLVFTLKTKALIVYLSLDFRLFLFDYCCLSQTDSTSGVFVFSLVTCDQKLHDVFVLTSFKIAVTLHTRFLSESGKENRLNILQKEIKSNYMETKILSFNISTKRYCFFKVQFLH